MNIHEIAISLMGNWATNNALPSYFSKEKLGANAALTNKINRLVGLCEIGKI